MTPKRLIAVAVALLLGAEGWALSNASPGDTISEVVWWLNEQWPVIGFLFGVLAGHFFWQRKR